jgi:hypothetical protein
MLKGNIYFLRKYPTVVTGFGQVLPQDLLDFPSHFFLRGFLFVPFLNQDFVFGVKQFFQ